MKFIVFYSVGPLDVSVIGVTGTDLVCPPEEQRDSAHSQSQDQQSLPCCSLRVTPLSGPGFAVVAPERVVRSQVEYPGSNFSKELENWEFACGWDELKLQPGLHSRE